MGRHQVKALVLGQVELAARGLAQASQRDDVDVGRGETELAQQRVYRLARIAGVVLQPAEALFGCTADDLAVAQDRRGRTVGLGDAEDDHRDVILSHRPPRPQRVLRYRPAARAAPNPCEEAAMTIEDEL